MLRTGDLTYGEQLMLWAARRWLANPGDWTRVGEEFALALGCARARAALAALEAILRTLHGGARRTIFLHRRDCCRVSADEHALLSVVAALQGGRVTRARALLEWLLPPAAVRAILPEATCLSEALAAAGHVLPNRPLAGATRVSGHTEPASAAIH
jgi:hypothetical protein